ncbi:Hypothetical predicted protein [Lecanosticta acicola]|uniref:Uncharacterized protein n=1 Tax=Lecanosticta acicola TaxID=111012 RepID=A0AAI9EDW9_9PEZI|nr:Hypothetical predicted protein [Lecanosticta acicola]
MPSLPPPLELVFVTICAFIISSVYNWSHRSPSPSPVARSNKPLDCLASIAGVNVTLLPQGVVPGLMAMMLPLKQQPDEYRARQSVNFLIVEGGGSGSSKDTSDNTENLWKMSRADWSLRETYRTLLSSLSTDYTHVSTTRNPLPPLYAWHLMRETANSTSAITALAHAALHNEHSSSLPHEFLYAFLCRFADTNVTSLPWASPHQWVAEMRRDCEMNRIRQKPMEALRLFMRAAHELRQACPREAGESVWKQAAHGESLESVTIAQELKPQILQRVDEISHTEGMRASRMVHYHCDPSHFSPITCPPAPYEPGFSQPVFETHEGVRSSHHAMCRVSSPARVFGNPVPGDKEEKMLNGLVEMWTTVVWAEWLGIVYEQIAKTVTTECENVMKVLDDEFEKLFDMIMSDETVADKEMAEEILKRTVRVFGRKIAGAETADRDEDAILGLFAKDVTTSTRQGGDDESEGEDEDEDDWVATNSWNWLSTPKNKGAPRNARTWDRLWRRIAWGKEWLRLRITPLWPYHHDLNHYGDAPTWNGVDALDAIDACLLYPFPYTNLTSESPEVAAYTIARGSVWIFWLKGTRPNWMVTGNNATGNETDGPGIKLDDVLVVRPLKREV